VRPFTSVEVGDVYDMLGIRSWTNARIEIARVDLSPGVAAIRRISAE